MQCFLAATRSRRAKGVVVRLSPEYSRHSSTSKVVCGIALPIGFSIASMSHLHESFCSRLSFNLQEFALFAIKLK